jgi:probable HAF family extracellular repeat protein
MQRDIVLDAGYGVGNVSNRRFPMRHISCAILIAAVCGCGTEPQPTQPLAAKQQLTAATQYDIAYLGTLNGSRNRASGINGDGAVAGFVNRPGNATRVAAYWHDGVLDTLGTLGGPNSVVQWPGLSNSGLIAGFAETAEPDTLNEEWSCTAFLPSVTGKICRGFFWEKGVMTSLPTLGGNQGFATSVNNRGQVVGWAETPVIDPTCNAPQVLQFRAVMWEPKKSTMMELRPLPGDSTSAATAINSKGQVVGISGACDIAVGQRSAAHNVIWNDGKPTDIGDLGGDFWHTPMDINEEGAVVGFSNPAYVLGIDFNPLAFLWTKEGGIQNLGKLVADTSSQALGINNLGQIVGVSSGAINRAVLWENGVIHNLNDLVEPGFPDLLIVAQHINDDGVIVGRAVLHGTTRQVPFVATPRN